MFLLKKPGSRKTKTRGFLDSQLGASPVSSLGVVLDLGLRLVAKPVRNRPILLLNFGKSSLGSKRLC